MFASNAYQQLEKMSHKEKISEETFYALIIYFRESFLDELDFKIRLKMHRKPIQFLNKILDKLYEDIRLSHQRPEMIHRETNLHGYVPTKIIQIWDQDRTLRNLYQATWYSCVLYEKDFNTIAVHIAEYRAINKLVSRLRKLVLKYNDNSRK
jgi:hypothetical protein